MQEQDIKAEELAPEVPDEEASSGLPEINVSSTDADASSQDDGEEVFSQDGKTDYAELERADISELKRDFPELSSLGRIIDLANPLRYAQLRDLGLSPREAYLASSGMSRRASGKRHLTGAVPGGAKVADSAMSPSELKGARELFGNLTDEELQRLYRRVTK